MESLEHTMERSRVSWRAQTCRWNGDVECRSSRWTASKFDRQIRFVTAVLAATGRDLPNCGFSAVAGGISFCCRPEIEEIGIRGDEHSSGRQGVSGDLRRTRSLLRPLIIYHPQSNGLECSNRCSRVLSGGSMSETGYPAKAGLS